MVHILFSSFCSLDECVDILRTRPCYLNLANINEIGMTLGKSNETQATLKDQRNE
jgi:hypothetical protein